MIVECPREQEIFDAVASGQWPGRVGPALREHVAGCAICRDIVDLVPVLHDDRDRAWSAAHVPNSGIVWWRAQLRARAEAAEQAARPMALVHAAAVACGVVVMIVVVMAGSGTLARWVMWLRALASSVAAQAPGLSGIAVGGVALAVAAGMILASVAVYLIAADD